MNELISIIIPTFNSAHFINETLDSVLEQTYKNWECIIVDDFSTDSTSAVIREYVEKDKRFSYYIKSKKDIKGASSSRNIGIKNARGKFIQFLDSDDLISENKLEEQLKILMGDRNAIITCKWGFFTENDKEVYDVNQFYKDFNSISEYLNLVGKYGGYFPLHCFLIPEKIIRKAGKWSEDLTLSDDSEFIFRVFLNSDKILFCSAANVLYRINNSQSLSTKKTVSKVKSLILSWKRIENNYFDTFGKGESAYLNNKKGEVYKTVKHSYPLLTVFNRAFFAKQIRDDKDRYLIKLYFFKIRNKILYLKSKYLKK